MKTSPSSWGDGFTGQLEGDRVTVYHSRVDTLSARYIHWSPWKRFETSRATGRALEEQTAVGRLVHGRVANRHRSFRSLFMVRIRLRRVGAKGHPAYRIVVTDQRAARDGAFVEQIGTYDPFPNPPAIKLDEEKALKWLRQGAQPSESVSQLLRSTGLLEKVR